MLGPKKNKIKKLIQVEYFRIIIDIILNTNSKNFFKKEIGINSYGKC